MLPFLQSFVDRFVVREIQNIQVACLNKRDGCCWEGELKLLEVSGGNG